MTRLCYGLLLVDIGNFFEIINHRNLQPMCTKMSTRILGLICVVLLLIDETCHPCVIKWIGSEQLSASIDGKRTVSDFIDAEENRL